MRAIQKFISRITLFGAMKKEGAENVDWLDPLCELIWRVRTMQCMQVYGRLGECQCTLAAIYFRNCPRHNLCNTIRITSHSPQSPAQTAVMEEIAVF